MPVTSVKPPPTGDSVATIADGYTGPQASEASGISYRQLDYWARTDLVVPSLRAARGSGSQRRYSYRDVLLLAIIKRLLDNGMSLQSVRRGLNRLQTLRVDELDGRALVLAGHQAFVTDLPDLAALMAGGATVFHVLPFANLVDQVDEALDRFDAVRAARATRSGGHAPIL